MSGTGSICDQHHPHAFDRCGAAGQIRPSRHADGAGAAGLHHLEPRHAFRSAGPDLAQPRPLRALERPRLDAALVGAASHRNAGGECRIREAGQPSVTLDDIRHFRQLDSKAPGHPEYHWVSGVETTTGPLGQGVATSVGMAIAQKWLASRYNRPGFDDFRLQHLCRLRRRLHDGRRRRRKRRRWPATWASTISAGFTTTTTSPSRATRSITFTEDVAARFLGYGWNVLRVGDANDIDRIEHALEVFRQTQGPADVHHSRQPHRLRLAAQAGHRRGARRAAGRGGDPPDQAQSTAGPRMRSSWCPTASMSISRPASASAARRPGGSGPSCSTAYRAEVSRARDRDRPDAAARTAGRVGPQPAGLSRRRQGHRGARRLGQGAERARAEYSLVPRRLGGPRAVEQDHADIRGRGRLSGRRAPAGRTCISASASTPWRRS